MKKIIFKLIPIMTACFLLFATASSSAVSATSLQENNLNNELNYTNLELIEPEESLIIPEINLENEIQPLALPVIPLLASLVIKKSVVYIVKTSKKNVIKLSAHSTLRAVERNITGEMLDEAFATGTKYVDLMTGERIMWAQLGPLGKRTAILLDPNSDEVDTVYDQSYPKGVWVKSNWKFKGDIK